MKKAAIVTLTVYNSLGNKLQNYALLKTLESLGCRADTLFIKGFEEIDPVPELKEFSDRYLHDVVVDFRDPKQTEGLAQQYDAFIVGSDQVWNYDFSAVNQFVDVFMLSFAPPEKRLSYAASFGGSKLCPEACAQYVAGLSEMQAISVREQEGAKIVKLLCGRTAAVHVDPTLLLPPEEYMKLARPSEYFPSEKFAVVNFLFEASEDQVSEIEAFGRENKLKIVDINWLLCEQKIGVEEFLYAMLHAEYIFTDSFHCTVFSILFHKPFLAYVCNIVGVASRLEHLLRLCGLEDRVYKNADSLSRFEMDYSTADRVIPREQQRSFRYLRDCLGLPTEERAYVVPRKEMCCGCTACAMACPKQCISMEQDAEGFRFPVIDEKLCIHCDRCKSVCPSLNPRKNSGEDRAFAVVHRDDRIRMQSSSGGVFTAFSKHILESGGVVFGAAWGEHLKVCHRYAETEQELARFRGSKYVQSDPGETFLQAQEFLKQGRQVLYTGTPCQIQGLRSFLGRDYENLFTVDLICFGTPSPLAWDKYVSYREHTQGQRAVYASFRNKMNGWHSPTVVFQFEDDSTALFPMEMDPFYNDFMKQLNLRRVCYQCPFRGECRAGDITIADFWGVEEAAPEMTDGFGTSLVLTHTPKGGQLLDAVQEQVICREVGPGPALKYNPCFFHSVEQPVGRAAYFAQLKEEKWYV